MRFYSIKCISKIKYKSADREQIVSTTSLSRKFGVMARVFSHDLPASGYFFVESADDEDLILGAAVSAELDFPSSLADFIKAARLDLASKQIEEVTFRDFCTSLGYACRNDFVHDDDDILKELGLLILSRRAGDSLNFGENILEPEKVTEYSEAAEKYGCKEALCEELDRVFAASSRRVLPGHPVHYMFMTDDLEARRECPRLLLSALYKAGRISSKRYTFMDIGASSDFSYSAYDALYESSRGGAVIVRYTAENETGDVLTAGRSVFAKICQTAEKYHSDVLTIFSFPVAETRVVKLFRSEMPGLSFVVIEEKSRTGEDARRYLKLKAKASSVRTDRKLWEKLSDTRAYTVAELNEIFGRWYDAKLIDSSYPEYKALCTKTPEEEEKHSRGSAYSQLMELIGLENAKKVITQALDFYKAQKLFRAKGMQEERPSMHMVFTGNPGSAKTTVARLFAEILRDSGVLPTGQLIEVGRADLVGKYVGWTAPAVKKAFRQAKGGVLFIDEAYSLVDDRDGMYGDEAINTIVQEMENLRDDLIVIFAGYPDKMESFLEKNPGLRSRIAFHVGFDDYSTEELCSIADLIAKDKNLRLTAGAKEKLAEVFDTAEKMPDFGNGRYVRNAIEKAQLAQASRLVHMDFDSITADDIHTITADDIELPEAKPSEKKNPIGFCA